MISIEPVNQNKINTKITGVDYNSIYERNEKLQKELWEREDKIRKETQDREDNAFRRAVNDMQKAGINPNLVGINPSSSGGGISSASKQENTLSTIASNLSKENIKGIEQTFEEYKFELEHDLALTKEEREQRQQAIDAAIDSVKAVGNLLPW